MKPVSAAVKKKRINFRLRKILSPKSPLMVLNELAGSVSYSFVDTSPTMMAPGIGHLFTAQCMVNSFLNRLPSFTLFIVNSQFRWMG